MPVWFSCLCALMGIIVPTITMFTNMKNVKKQDAEEMANRKADNKLMNYKLDTISNDVKDVKFDVASTKTEVGRLSERLAQVEQSVKSAHNRIDEIKRGEHK